LWFGVLREGKTSPCAGGTALCASPAQCTALPSGPLLNRLFSQPLVNFPYPGSHKPAEGR